MARGTLFRNCNWGLDYDLGKNMPVECARRPRVLGQLNVLHVYHLFETNNRDSAVRSLTAGGKFSHDLANSGSLFAALNAKNLLVSHLRVVSRLARLKQLSAAQRSQRQIAVASLGKGLDWQMAAKHESMLASLDQAIEASPEDLARVIPIPARILEHKRELNETVQRVRLLLQ